MLKPIKNCTICVVCKKHPCQAFNFSCENKIFHVKISLLLIGKAPVEWVYRKKVLKLFLSRFDLESIMTSSDDWRIFRIIGNTIGENYGSTNLCKHHVKCVNRLMLSNCPVFQRLGNTFAKYGGMRGSFYNTS